MAEPTKLVEWRGKRHLVLRERGDNLFIVQAKKDGTRMPRRVSVMVHRSEVKVVEVSS